jgi:hypothetical protein
MAVLAGLALLVAVQGQPLELDRLHWLAVEPPSARHALHGRPVPVADLDGDGLTDLVVPREPGQCRSGLVMGDAVALSGADLAPLGRLELGQVGFSMHLDRVPGAGTLVWSQVALARFEDLRGAPGSALAPGWSRSLDDLRPCIDRAARVGDLDGDGEPDLVALSFRAGPIPRTSTLVARSARDGRVLWVRRQPDDGVELWSAPCEIEDRDGDGVPDLAVLAAPPGRSVERVIFASGRDGTTLAVEDLPGPCLARLAAVGDLDGDGRQELALWAPSCEFVGVRSSRTGGWLDAGSGWRLAWLDGSCDQRGEGAPGLVVGRVRDSTGERRISAWTAASLRDLRTPHIDEPAWTRVRHATVVRTAPGRAWQAVLVLAGAPEVLLLVPGI